MMSGPGNDAVIVERRDAVLTVTMNRPRTLNVLDEAMADALLAAFAGLQEDASIRAVILRGAGRSFMAGGDLARFRADLDRAPATAGRLIDAFHALLRVIKAMPQPVVAAVQGPVAGGGIALAFACDLVVSADDATFLSAYTKLGASPDGGTTSSLTRLLGPRRALEFVLFNDTIDAATALGLGLVNKVAPAGELDSAAQAMAARIVQGSAGANAAAKRLIQSAGLLSFEEQLEREKASFIACAGAPDFREGILAFFEKRRARF
jgi:2-(1,2-epoxy-1,2-dihydrophenyl)acetyl-CoA isomerase